MGEADPSGVVTFLFADFEGSTRLWELHAGPMKSAMARHDAILRDAVEGHHGRIVKMTGDGCHACFDTAVGAIDAALAAQKCFIADPWPEIQPDRVRVRMAVHTGEAEPRAGDYYGSAVNRAARLMSVAHGGQVLVSAAAAEMVRDLLPSGTDLLDLGEHRLKDLVRAEHVYQLVHPDLPAGFPPIRSLDAFPNNLPVQITSFVGREREIEEAKRILSGARLVTFTGSGGVGKTRLSLQVGAELLTVFPDGVWLVELASLSDASLVLPALAAVLELRAPPGMPLLHFVTSYLRGKRMLIILDNCEHLIGACAELADHLLRNSPGLKILASSREGLGIAGEVTYHVPSLSLPPLGPIGAEELSSSESARLFTERASAANPHFAPTARNAPAIAQICRRLDGIPLALELAAARTKLFTAEQIAPRLDDRFRLLTGGSRTAVPRQQTLRATIDWSYDLLSEPERVMLRALSIFSGGWTFEAADAVCHDLDVLSLLDQLVNKSLVVTEERYGRVRYDMLETIRQYAREKLIEAGEARDRRDRHFAYLLGLSGEAERGLRGGAAFNWLERLAEDEDNIREAVEWGRDRHVVDALLLLGNLVFYWAYGSDKPRQAYDLVCDLLAKMEGLGDQGPRDARRVRARARGLTTRGLLLVQLGGWHAGTAAFSQAAPEERKVGDNLYLALALGMSSAVALMSGDLTSTRSALEESVALLRSSDDKRWLPLGLVPLSTLETMAGHEARAEALRQELRQHLRHLDHPMFVPTLLELGEDAVSRGRPDEAEEYLREGLRLAQRLRSRYFVVLMESELAHRARERGDLQEAKDAYRKLIQSWKEYGQMGAVAHQLECFASIASAEGEVERAARLFGAGQALRENAQAPMRGNERAQWDESVSALRRRMPPEAFEAAWSDGRAMDMDAAVRYAVTPVEDAAARAETER